MRFIAGLTIFVLMFVVYGFYLSQFDFQVYRNTTAQGPVKGYYDYRVIMNVHSNKSLGSSSALQIIESAKATKTDVLIFTDLNLFNEDTIKEGYYSQTLVLSGHKYSYLDSRVMTIDENADSLGSNLGDVQLQISNQLTLESSQRKNRIYILNHPFFVWI